MERREFITLLGGAVVTWPFAARAQQPEQIRRIGVLMNRPADNYEGKARVAAFQEAIQQLGWSNGRNVRIDIRWGEDNIDSQRRGAAELVALAPEVVLASGTLSVAALQQVSRTLPIVFVGVTDPVGSGLIDSLAQPGGNVTGFMIYEYSFGGKRLELLKQIAPNVTQVAVVRDPTNSAGSGEFAAIQAVAQSLKVQVSPVDSRRDAAEIERVITAFARSPNGGLILTPGASASVRRDLIVTLCAQNKLPAVYPFHYMVTGGGLVSYGADVVDQCRRAAGYVDRILKGEKVANLPVQAPTKFELVINLKTAKALGLAVPPAVLVRADEVIE
jgi:putative tryptophan/tyrosine transport system substrate-binding protein